LIKMMISNFPGEIKRKYQMLSLVVFSIFDSIEECEYLQHEDLEFVSQIEDLFLLDLNTNTLSDEYFDSTPDSEFIRLQADIDLLF